jgi:hypothetical protein
METKERYQLHTILTADMDDKNTRVLEGTRQSNTNHVTNSTEHKWFN